MCTPPQEVCHRRLRSGHCGEGLISASARTFKVNLNVEQLVLHRVSAPKRGCPRPPLLRSCRIADGRTIGGWNQGRYIAQPTMDDALFCYLRCAA
jgi:hypothetical protein